MFCTKDNSWSLVVDKYADSFINVDRVADNGVPSFYQNFF